MTVQDTLTTDYIFEGRLRLSQQKNGFRFSVDAPLLVWYASRSGPVRNCVDLGAGSGIVGLGLLLSGTAAHTLAVELQKPMCHLCTKNAEEAGLTERFRVVQSDMSHLGESLPPNSAELVVMNPPYWPLGNGRLPQNDEKKIAGHEIHGNIALWVKTASRLIRGTRGRVNMVFPARRMDVLLDALKLAKMAATKATLVYPTFEGPAELVLIEATLATPGRITWEQPLILKNADGSDTTAAKEILSGSFSEQLKELPDLRSPNQMPR